ncbi:MAG TPA: PQQ-dependent sugar dehydrogenase [Vicinamibacterales bacterium]|nr:PQQ-dependent sugar dehydrogenase [Vicinamibacterales bacterium]
MKWLNALGAATAAVILCLSVPLLAAIQLVPVVSSGLVEPLFLTHAGDGSNRLFIVEQRGVIRVLQPGGSSAATFLDIRSRILAGGERGLLGLAFHPLHESNGRFFVYYTRTGDGALVIAEYNLTGDRNVANPSERILLTIPHPNFGNHNGGMLAFGPDNFLYIGVGDGGSGNDPPNNAQRLDELLGKVLRIDVNADGGLPYVSPPGNPFVNMANARGEIFAYGLRNPWRFSFDRFTGQLWLADVGQGAREEVNMPIVSGGNYGWRVYEGSACTGIDAVLCNPANFKPPIFDYTHANGRCSITGGYVYRGTQSTLPDGAYFYGDFCTGEIFSWNGASQTLELDTTMSISSFGEDEAGEIYVVNLNGSVSRLMSTSPPCSISISPTTRNVVAAGGTGSVAVTVGAGCGWTATSNAAWLRVTSGTSGTGNGSVAYSIDANTSATSRSGTVTIGGRTFTVAQNGNVACAFAISPSQASYPREGGTATVAVTADFGCDWQATSHASWITISGEPAGSGNGTVTYVVAPRAGRLGTRGGRLTIAGQRFTIRQSR